MASFEYEEIRGRLIETWFRAICVKTFLFCVSLITLPFGLQLGEASLFGVALLIVAAGASLKFGVEWTLLLIKGCRL